MTREEAIEHLSVLAERMDTKDTDVYVADIPLKCVDMAIEALETEPILDKIRADIERYKSNIDNAISEDELKIEGMKEAYADCIKIIYKYRTESEDNE